ncbi:MAG: hypothetical protein HUU20_15485 [Pirellulales bacterium]|nr:hypothetical protein [Pirellulales bacterium]
MLLCATWNVRAEEVPPEMALSKDAAQGPKALSVVLESAWRPTEATISIPIGETATSTALKAALPAVPEGKIAILRLRTRVVSAGFGGWNNLLQIHINDTPLDAFTKDGTARILNRSDTTMRTSDPRYPNEAYFKNAGGTGVGLLTAFGPSWDTLEPRFLADREELHWYLFDVSDLVKSGAENTLRLVNLAQAKWFKKTPEQLKDSPLLVASVEIGLADISVRDRFAEQYDKAIGAFRPAGQVQSNGVELAASTGGGLRVRAAGEDYFCRASFSEPGEKIRFNRFDLPPASGWKVSVTHPAPDRLVIVGETKSYRITRTAALDGAFIRLEDAVENLLNEPVGMLIQHELIAGTPAAAWRLSGLPNLPAHDWTCDNPTLHFSGVRTGVGVAVRDSVMRSQMSSTGSRRKLSFSNEHFGLAAGARYTFRWSLYVGGPDFWEFLNAVRRDWDANHTVPGMYAFWYPESDANVRAAMESPGALGAYLKRKKIDVFAVSPWFEYYYPKEAWQPREVYKKTVQETMAKIKAVRPDAKVIACLETFLYYQPESFFQGTLPKFWTDAKGVVPREQASHDFSLGTAGTKVIGATPWADSVFRDPNGDVVVDLYYSMHYRDGGANLKLFPVRGNYWHDKFLDVINYCIHDCGLDGVYIDSFTYYTNQTYGRWDGATVDIDRATGRIVKPYARLNLLTRDSRRDWVKSVTDLGKIVYVNGKPDVAEVQDLPMVSFMEAEWTFDPFAERLESPRAAQVQLSSPVALGVRAQRWDPQYKTQYAEIVQKAVIAYLRHGALYCHYTTEIPEPGQPGGGEYGILNHMYPFTPVELNEGFVIGKQRILTAVSRTFTWPRPEKPACLRFGLRGMPVEGGFDLQKTGDGWTVKVSLKDWNETAVIESATE